MKHSKITDGLSLAQAAVRFVLTLFMVAGLACSASGLSGARVPFDLPQFKPVLSESRLHSPSSSPSTVSRGRFDRYELPGRFYLGSGGSTLVLATTNSGRDRSELRHNSNWSVMNDEMTFFARLRFDRPEAIGQRGAHTFVQIHVQDFMGNQTGPLMMMNCSSSDQLTARVRQDFAPNKKNQKTHNLGQKPNGFFNLIVHVKKGKLRIFINDKLMAEDDVSAFAPTTVYFKTGAYIHSIKPQAVEFESLSIGAGAPGQIMPSNPGIPSTAATIVRAEAMRGTPYQTIIGEDASDPYYNQLTFEKVSGPGWLTIAPNGEISGTPFSRDVGLNSFEVKVTNHEGKSVNITLQITVE